VNAFVGFTYRYLFYTSRQEEERKIQEAMEELALNVETRSNCPRGDSIDDGVDGIVMCCFAFNGRKRYLGCNQC
jgi:hypothetical protein